MHGCGRIRKIAEAQMKLEMPATQAPRELVKGWLCPVSSAKDVFATDQGAALFHNCERSLCETLDTKYADGYIKYADG